MGVLEIEFCDACAHPRYFHGAGGCSGQIGYSVGKEGWSQCGCDLTFTARQHFHAGLTRETVTRRQRIVQEVYGESGDLENRP